MLGETWLNDLAPQASDPRIRAFLVAFHQRGKADNVCR
jgi:hypothetical protein